MESEWPLLTIGKLIENGEAKLQTGPFGTALKSAEYSEEGVPLISVREIREGFLQITEHTPKVDESIVNRLSKFVLKKGDIVFGRKGGVERNALIKGSEEGWFLGSDGIYLRLKDKKLAEYLSILFRSQQIRNWLLTNSEGTTMPSLNQKILARLPFKLPPSAIRNEICSIIHRFDDKIELNKKINQTLEQIAQALFKSWFVDFDPVFDNLLDKHNNNLEKAKAYLTQKGAEDLCEKLTKRYEQRQQVKDQKPLPQDIRDLFPSDFYYHEEMGWVPEGWEVSTTHDEFEVLGGGTPSTKTEEFWVKGNIAWTTPKDLSSNSTKVLLDTERKITQLGLQKISSGILPVNTVLMSSRAPVGYLALARIPVAINQGYIALKCKEALNPFYTIQWLESVVDEIKGISGGTTFQEISKKTFKSIRLIRPRSELTSLFGNSIASYYEKIEANLKNQRELASLRNRLLPKLVSGEISLGGNE